MKQLSFAIEFTNLVASCIPPGHITKNVNLSEIVDAPGISKDDLYVDTNSWRAEFFTSHTSVVQFQNKEVGKVIGRFRHAFNETNPHLRDFVIEIDIKNEESKISLKRSVNSDERDGSDSNYFDRNRNPFYRANSDEYSLSEILFDTMVSDSVDYLNEDKSW